MNIRKILNVTVIAIAVLATTIGVCHAEVDYPPEWGNNIALPQNGCTLVTFSTEDGEYKASKLFDDDARESHHWEGRENSLPSYIIIKFDAVRRFDRIQFTTQSKADDGKLSSLPKKVELWTSQDIEDNLKLNRSFTLERERVQIVEFEPVEAKYVKFVITSTFSKSWVEIGEIALFSTRMGPIEAIRGTKEYDILTLKNGDLLTGHMKDEEIILQTSYSKLIFPKANVASLLFEGGISNIEKVVLLNGDVFSGFILNKAFTLALTSGPEVVIRKEKIKTLGIQIFPTEKDTYPEHDVCKLKNGDMFNGQVTNTQITVKTSYATIPCKVSDIAMIEFIGEKKIVSKITLRNRNTMQGILMEEDLIIKLDYGPEVTIYKDRFDVIKFD